MQNKNTSGKNKTKKSSVSGTKSKAGAKNKFKSSSYSKQRNVKSEIVFKKPKKEKKIKKETSPGAATAREVAKVIQWFPGHMTKALREIEESLKLVDLVLELCDARIPVSSRNPKVAEIVGSKPVITIMNKSSLSDAKQNELWKEHFVQNGRKVIFTDCITGEGINQIVPAIRTALSEKLASYSAKGMRKLPRVMIMGVTNCGKSTLINRLYGSKKAKSENRPGVTRNQQWVTVENTVELLDTPGVLWPKFDDEKVGLNLAFTGAIRDEILDLESIAVLLCGKLLSDYPHLLLERYKLTQEEIHHKAPHEVFELIGKKRGLLISGGEVDFTRTTKMLVDEFRSGKIGRITLDKLS